MRMNKETNLKVQRMTTMKSKFSLLSQFTHTDREEAEETANISGRMTGLDKQILDSA